MTVRSTLGKLPRLALDLLFPLQCLGCQKEGKLICDSCVGPLARLENPYCVLCCQPNPDLKCRLCRQATPWYDGIRAPYLMQGPIREGIHSLKYRGVRSAATQLGSLLAQYWAGHPIPGNVIVPVPLHPKRLRHRGYNQSALLAKELAKLSGFKMDEGLLVRSKDSLPQVDAASRGQRLANVEGNFQTVGGVEGLEVILVDDVATTGSTLSACASALKASGAASVWGLVLAREVSARDV